MLRIFYVFLTIFMIMPSWAKADNFIAVSKISAATVYTNRAKVTRIATVDMRKGAHKVVFENLPANLMTDSLRVEGSSEVDIVFGAVMHKRVMSSELSSVREKELNDKLQKIQDEITVINVEYRALNDKKKFIKNIGEQAELRTDEEIAKLNLNSEQWTSAANVIYKNISDIEKAKTAIDFKKRDLNKEIQRIRGEINQLRTGNKSSYKITIPLEAEADSKLTIELSYQVPNATWKPLYDARLTTAENSGLEILQYGAVTQRTGEDWIDVALTLSTAQPQRGTSLRNLTPFWVNIWKNNPRKMQVQSMASSSRSKAPWTMADKENLSIDPLQEWRKTAEARRFEMDFPEEKTAQFRRAQINTGGFVSEYKIPGPSTILADGSETKLMIGTFDTDNSIEVHIKPQLSTDAFLVAKAKLKGESPILPGKVNLFRDGAYVGKANFPLLRPDEEHELYFGIDDQVSVKRKVLKDELKEEGLIAKDKVQERHFVTEIKNQHKNTIEIVVKETTPVGKNERIVAEILPEFTSKGYKKDAENIKGQLLWKFTMQPKSSKDLKLGWTVTWPKEFNIRGL